MNNLKNNPLVLLRKVGFYCMLLAIFVYAVFPFYYAIITSFKSGNEIFKVSYFPTSVDLKNYFAILTQGSFLKNLANSLFVATVVVIISLLLSITAAFALARVDFKGRALILLTILSVSMFPQVAVLAGLFELVRNLGLYNSLWSLVLTYMIFTLPFTVWVLTTFMREIPIELEEAAIVDGASSWQIITKVFMPIMWPAMVTTGLLAFIVAWNEFLFAFTFISTDEMRTVPVAIALISGATEHELPWGLLMSASVIVTVPLVILVLIFQRKIISGLTAGGVKG